MLISPQIIQWRKGVHFLSVANKELQVSAQLGAKKRRYEQKIGPRLLSISKFQVQASERVNKYAIL